MISFGNTPVPYTASWTAEERFYVAPCRFAGRRLAICQDEARGEGKPLFAKPHAQRQREVIARCHCDLCGRSLKAATKVSLSHARPQPHGAEGWAILQVEPMLHRGCAAECIRFCPSLRRDLDRGLLMIRQVTQWRAQFAIMDEVYTEEVTGTRCKAIGHAKVELLNWIDRDLDWLERAA